LGAAFVCVFPGPSILTGGGGDEGTAAAMIPISSGVRVWIATGHTDMRRGMNGLTLQGR
jgi:hypothetical protein